MPENKNTLLDTIGLLTEAEVRHRKQWRAQPSLAKSYQKGHNLTEIQDEFIWETHDGDNQGFPVPIDSHRLAPEPSNPLLPSCFNGNYNLQLTGGNSKERQKRTKNKKATIFYRTYHKPAQELAEEEWQTGEKDITILNDRDIHTYKSQYPQLFGTLTTYQKRADASYPSVYPSELRSLLYIFHNILHYSFRPSPTLSPEDIHQVALVACSSDSQVETYYRLAREQHLVTSLPQAKTFSLRQQLPASKRSSL